MKLSNWIFLVFAFAISHATNSITAQSQNIEEAWDTENDRQFDFWIGTWDVNLRMIQPDHTWKDSVKARAKIYPILDGKAILELWDSQPIKGFSLRYYDRNQGKWVLYLNWPNNGSRSSIGSLAGRFRHRRGEFFTKRGDRISRFTFCDITPTSLRWDDAYSNDGGKTWTHNWIMEFSRTAEKASWPAGDEAHTYHEGDRCQGAPFEKINRLAGTWHGKLILGNDTSETVDAQMRAYRILDGCSVIHFINWEKGGTTYRQFGLLTWNAQREQFEQLRLDNQPGSPAQLFRGEDTEGGLELSFTRQNGEESIEWKHAWTFRDDGSLAVKVSRQPRDQAPEVSFEGRLTRSR